MVLAEQLTSDREVPAHNLPEVPMRRSPGGEREAGERAARESLRAQVAKLERELSGIVADGFPHIPASGGACGLAAGPRLLTLGELERQRDGLALRVCEARQRVVERAELERRARLLLQRMRLEPGRYKFARLRVADLGEGGCGVWEVRPRLGLIGMLAGWWQLKLSSGCPLAGGPRPCARPRPDRWSVVGGRRRCAAQRLRAIAPSRRGVGVIALGCGVGRTAISIAASVRR